MKKTDKISYRQKSPQELNQTLIDLRKQFIEAKAKFATGNQSDISVFKKIKNQISLVLTLLSESNNEKQN